MWRTSCPIAPSPRGVRCPIFLLDQFFRRFDLFQQQKIEAQSIFLISEIQTMDFLSDLIYFNRKKRGSVDFSTKKIEPRFLSDLFSTKKIKPRSIFQPKKLSLDFYLIYFKKKPLRLILPSPSSGCASQSAHLQ